MEKLTKKEKVLIGVSIIGIGVAGYFGYKYLDMSKLLNSKQDEIKDVKEELNFLKFLVIESGCIPKAKQNGNNKLAREESKIQALADALIKCPNDMEIKRAIEKHKDEHAAIAYQLCNIDKIEELINNDKPIYAK